MGKTYIFGYGSLVNNYSFLSSVGGITGFNETQMDSLENVFCFGVSKRNGESNNNMKKETVFCRIADIQRGWYIHDMSPDIKRGGLAKYPTYLGAYEKLGSTCNGILIEVDEEELACLVEREKGYNKVQIDPKRITILHGSMPAAADAKIYYFEVPKSALFKPSSKHPIVQSYVDLCMKGFIQIDEILGTSNYKHTREFIQTTKCWNKHWVNDRLHPYRPFVFLNKSAIINKILSKTIPLHILHNIQSVKHY